MKRNKINFNNEMKLKIILNFQLKKNEGRLYFKGVRLLSSILIVFNKLFIFRVYYTRMDANKRLQVAAFEKVLLWTEYFLPSVQKDGASCLTAVVRVGSAHHRRITAIEIAKL